MATSFISNIFDDFTLAYANGPQSIIDFFTKNTIAFNNLKTFDNDDDLHLYLKMACHYSDALYQKGRYNDTVDVINKSILVIDSEIIRLGLTEFKDDWYYSILFYKGMASYGLNDYKTATPIFKELVAYDPKNEKYENWLRNSILRRRSRIVIVIYVVCGLLLFFQIVSKGFSWYSYTFRQTVSIIGFLTALSTVAYEYYLKRNLRKSKIS